MAENGVDCIELQIPFSEPIADGPVISKANQKSLQNGTTVRECILFAEQMAVEFPQVHFLFMTYYNIVYKYGERAFLEKTKKIGFTGTIIGDLPPEEGQSYVAASRELDLAPIVFFTPTSTFERMQDVAKYGEGFVYCVARKGVTGKQTALDEHVAVYLEQCRKATDLPLAVGFGISGAADVQKLQGRADMAVIGTATIRLVDEKGPSAVGAFIAGLRD